MTLPSNAFARVTHRMTGPGLRYPAEVTYAVSLDGPGSQTVASVLGSQFNTHVMPRLSDGILHSSTTLKVGPDEDGPSYVSTANQLGGRAGTAASCNVSWLVHKNSTLGGRRGKGRLYLPGVMEADVGSDGDMLDAQVTLMQTAMDAWYAGINGVSSVGTYVLEHAPGISAEPLPTAVLSLTVDGHAATQRRRMRR